LTDARGLLVPVAALLGLAAVATVAWSELLDGFAIAVAPVAALSAPALVGPRPGRRAAGALAVWLLAAPLLAGVPADQLRPGAWGALPGHLIDGVLQVAAPDAPGAGDDPWRLAAGLLLTGAAWIAAAALARRRPSLAFAAGAAPWLAAVVLEEAQAVVWQGAVVVAAGLLWQAWPRTSARAAVALSVFVALASGITAQAVAPRHSWFGSHGQALARFRLLETRPTFEPLADRRTGAAMLEVKASEPAFWRMQALDVFDGHGWWVSSQAPRLPEPAAQPVGVDVRVRGLENDLVVSPGPIDHLEAPGRAQAVAGGGWRLVPGPRAGGGYHVDAAVVRAGAGDLQHARPPHDPRLAAYTRLGWGGGPSNRAPVVLHIGSVTFRLASPGFRQRALAAEVPLFGEPRDARTTAALARSPYRGVAVLARRLASGAETQWQVVARVMRYLRDEDRFRYTTDVGPPGPFPLVDFLLRTHAGYCQHFAGAAALLLRLAGVPARMVAGFAPGVRSGGRFKVRDLDAHDWIEVYFEGYGWVPFNPTPAAAPAAIPRELDLFATSEARAGVLGLREYAILAALAAVALAGWRRRRRLPLGDALAHLLGTRVPPSNTLAELADELARTLGPRTSALAAEAERARFAPQGAERRRWTSTRIACALARDIGPWRAVLLLALPGAVRPRISGRPTVGAASAGARSSQQPVQGDLS
jgi:transglutaminase-like putative cysteine protease